MRSGVDPSEVAWEIALENGLPLSSAVQELDVSGTLVFRFEDDLRGHAIHITLAPTVSIDVVNALQLSAGDLFICRDSALDDDAAANMVRRCRLMTV